jgi:TPR repeat protein
MYENGKGVKQDYNQAIKWWCMAAEQGHYGADYNLGMMFYRGTGVPKDREEAARRLLKVAKQGIPGAQYQLGLMYMNGDGAVKSLSQAKHWLNRAYENIDPDISKDAKKAQEKMDFTSPKIQLF